MVDKKVLKKSTNKGSDRLESEISRLKNRLETTAPDSPDKSPKKETSHPHDDPEFVKTGIKGFDALFERGIPRSSSVLLSGDAGSGKTIMGLHILANASKSGKKCLFMSFEENEDRLRQHMRDFGWDPEPAERSGNLMIKRYTLTDVTRSLEAMIAKSEGELVVDVKPFIIPKDFEPDVIIVDSLSAISSIFEGNQSYRRYVDYVFQYFESIGATTFLITEIVGDILNTGSMGIEKFLADGVVYLYNRRKGGIRESAIEVLKMRGAEHKKRIVAMRIVTGKGIEIYPEQEVFGDVGGDSA